jgi:hypothetical protein
MITWNHARRDALQMLAMFTANNWRGSRNSVNAGVDVWRLHATLRDIVRRP